MLTMLLENILRHQSGRFDGVIALSYRTASCKQSDYYLKNPTQHKLTCKFNTLHNELCRTLANRTPCEQLLFSQCNVILGKCDAMWLHAIWLNTVGLWELQTVAAL